MIAHLWFQYRTRLYKVKWADRSKSTCQKILKLDLVKPHILKACMKNDILTSCRVVIFNQMVYFWPLSCLRYVSRSFCNQAKTSQWSGINGKNKMAIPVWFSRVVQSDAKFSDHGPNQNDDDRAGPIMDRSLPHPWIFAAVLMALYSFLSQVLAIIENFF